MERDGYKAVVKPPTMNMNMWVCHWSVIRMGNIEASDSEVSDVATDAKRAAVGKAHSHLKTLMEVDDAS